MDDRILAHYLDAFRSGEDLDPAEAETLLDTLIGSDDEVAIAEVLSAWNAKGITEDELFALAGIMRGRMQRISTKHKNFVDIVGTGGSSSKTFNVSTASSFVVAGSGLPVAKHGNRAATSGSGSSDVLSYLGVDVGVSPKTCVDHLDRLGICFMFAPRFHRLSPALASARKKLGEPTIFNSLGPLCNPASAPFQLIGVWNPDLLETTARVLARLGTTKSWLIHARNGLDEISIAGRTDVFEVTGDKVERFEIGSPDFGVYSLGKGLPTGCSVATSAQIIRDVLENRMNDSDAERLILINAAAAIYLSDPSTDLRDAYEKAFHSVRSGAAKEKLDLLAGATI
jgi:anthranilate phosphoribosyltransferase